MSRDEVRALHQSGGLSAPEELSEIILDREIDVIIQPCVGLAFYCVCFMVVRAKVGKPVVSRSARPEAERALEL